MTKRRENVDLPANDTEPTRVDSEPAASENERERRKRETLRVPSDPVPRESGIKSSDVTVRDTVIDFSPHGLSADPSVERTVREEIRERISIPPTPAIWQRETEQIVITEDTSALAEVKPDPVTPEVVVEEPAVAVPALKFRDENSAEISVTGIDLSGENADSSKDLISALLAEEEQEIDDVETLVESEEVTADAEVETAEAAAVSTVVTAPPSASASTPPSGDGKVSVATATQGRDDTHATHGSEQAVAAMRSSIPPIPPIPSIPPTPTVPYVEGDHSELYAERTRVRAWWEELFDDLYLRTVAPLTPEQVKRQCDFIEQSLDLNKGARILDVGCGMGLQAAELASRGYEVVGLDLSEFMLARSAQTALDRGVDVKLLRGDMRKLDFVSEFDAVICLSTTFGYFDEETNHDVMKRFYAALKPRGSVLVDVVNRDHALVRQPHMVWFQGQGCICMEETNFNYISSRLHVKRTVLADNGTQREIEYTMRLYTLHELGKLMHRVGFRVSEVSGREATRGVFFGVDSPRLIMLGTRRTRTMTSAPPASLE